MRSFFQLAGAAVAVASAAHFVKLRHGLAIGVALFAVGFLFPAAPAESSTAS